MNRVDSVLLGVGSNLGDRLRNLRDAVDRIASEVEVEAVSSVWQTPPEGGTDQPRYLNLVIRARTPMEPREVLELARRVEGAGGRERPYQGAPRTVDVDVLFHGERIVDEPDLRIPHPRWSERSFVLRPLVEVAAGLRDPRSGRTVEEVWEERRPGPRPIRKVDPDEPLRERS